MTKQLTRWVASKDRENTQSQMILYKHSKIIKFITYEIEVLYFKYTLLGYGLAFWYFNNHFDN